MTTLALVIEKVVITSSACNDVQAGHVLTAAEDQCLRTFDVYCWDCLDDDCFDDRANNETPNGLHSRSE